LKQLNKFYLTEKQYKIDVEYTNILFHIFYPRCLADRNWGVSLEIFTPIPASTFFTFWLLLY